METVFSIVLFLVVYVPVAYMVYDELTGRRSRVRVPGARRAPLQRRRQRLELARGPRH